MDVILEKAFFFAYLFVVTKVKIVFKNIVTQERVSEMIRFRQGCVNTSQGFSVLGESYSTVFRDACFFI